MPKVSKTTEIPLSARHWNGDQVCAIDTETTGLIPGYHEIVQVAIVPLDASFRRRKDIAPLNLLIKPLYPERAIGVPWSDEFLDTVNRYGLEGAAAVEKFEQWYDSLKLPYKKYGSIQNKVIPLGHNYSFDKGFLQAWLGPENYDHYFHYHFRDSMISGLMRNDEAARKCEPVPFTRVGLGPMCRKLNVSNPDAHNALSDAVACAEVYRKLLLMGGLL